MHPQREAMLWINVVGGAAVLGGYAHGLATHPEGGEALWGGVLARLRPLHTAGMLLAALGDLAFTYFLLVHLDPDNAQVGCRLRFPLFQGLYVGILIPSALWMPLTWGMIEQPSEALWLGTRAVLATVGLSALGMLVALVQVRPNDPRWAHQLALIGGVVFFLHPGVLDAIVWPAFLGK